MVCKPVNELLENAAAMFVIFKLVEAGACGREQDNVAGLRRARSDFHRAMQCPRTFDGDAAGDLAFDFLGGSADEQGKNCLFTQRRLQNRVVAALVLAAENN